MPLARPKLAPREFDIFRVRVQHAGSVVGIEAQHPEEFLTHQFHLSQPAFVQAGEDCAGAIEESAEIG